MYHTKTVTQFIKKPSNSKLVPSTHNSIIWDEIIKILKKNGIKVELKS